jgi:hypothetical protein
MSDTSTTDTGASGDQTDDTSTDTGEQEPDWKAEAEKWKSQSRKHEERARANSNAAKELEKVRQQSMTETEKAVAQAREEGKAEGRTETTKTLAARLVDSEVKAAAAGRSVDVAALLDGLDRSRFLTDDGEPDVKAITSWMDRIAPTKTRLDLGQGPRGGNGGSNSGSFLTDAIRRARSG